MATTANAAADAVDLLQATAPQAIANAILGPCAIGWCLQLVFGGMATGLAGSLLLTKKARVGRLSWPLLLAATLFNLAAMAVNAAEIWQYMLNQQRSSSDLNGYTAADCIAPLFEGMATAMCQIFMGIRCVKIAGKSVWLCCLIGCGIAASLAGAIWLTVANFMYRSGRVGPGGLLVPTELWLWGSVATDVTLTVILSYSLRKMKRGFNKSTDQFISSLIYLSFGTCAIPLLFTVFTASVYAATYRLDTLWNLFNATAPAVPAFYVISFCYCLRASVSKHTKMESSSFTPGSASKGITDQFGYLESGTTASDSYRRDGPVRVSLPALSKRPSLLKRPSQLQFRVEALDEDEDEAGLNVDLEDMSEIPRPGRFAPLERFDPHASYVARSMTVTEEQPSQIPADHLPNRRSGQDLSGANNLLSGVLVTVDSHTVSED